MLWLYGVAWHQPMAESIAWARTTVAEAIPAPTTLSGASRGRGTHHRPAGAFARPRAAPQRPPALRRRSMRPQRDVRRGRPAPVDPRDADGTRDRGRKCRARGCCAPAWRHDWRRADSGRATRTAPRPHCRRRANQDAIAGSVKRRTITIRPTCSRRNRRAPRGSADFHRGPSSKPVVRKSGVRTGMPRHQRRAFCAGLSPGSDLVAFRLRANGIRRACSPPEMRLDAAIKTWGEGRSQGIVARRS